MATQNMIFQRKDIYSCPSSIRTNFVLGRLPAISKLINLNIVGLLLFRRASHQLHHPVTDGSSL